VSGSTRTFTYGADGQLDSCSTPSCTVTYDASGRSATITDNGVSWTFAYDADGRLISACKSTACTGSIDRVDSLYDGSGHRTQIKETTSAGVVTTTDLRYQGDTVVQELVGGTVSRTYATDDTGRIVEVCDPDCATGTVYVVVYNGHGDATGLWKQEASGALTLANSYTYSTWGTPTVRDGSGTVLTWTDPANLRFRYLYVGASDVQWDASFGLNLHYMHARHYSPTLGRFIQPDPSGAEANLYGYADNSPITRADATGRCWQLAAFAELGPIAWGATAICVGGVGLIALLTTQTAVRLYNHWCGNGRCHINLHPAQRSVRFSLANPFRGCAIGHGWTACNHIHMTRDNQVPSWVPRDIYVLPGESGNDVAKRLLDDRYGPGNWPTGPATEHNRIKKWADRKLIRK
jgi:RHS repeat-associated protein